MEESLVLIPILFVLLCFIWAIALTVRSSKNRRASEEAEKRIDALEYDIKTLRESLQRLQPGHSHTPSTPSEPVATATEYVLHPVRHRAPIADPLPKAVPQPAAKADAAPLLPEPAATVEAPTPPPPPRPIHVEVGEAPQPPARPATSAPPRPPVFASLEFAESVKSPEAAAAETAQKPTVSLEERLGTNWLNKIGIVILVIGLSFFLAYQLKNLGPAGKVTLGLALSAVLLVGGLLLERRDNYRIFARAGIGGGWALTFFLAYAMYHIDATRVLTSQAADLILMALVACGMVWHSLRYRSQVVTGLAFLLAYTTIAISQVTIFTLIAGAILTLGLVVVTVRYGWYLLELAGLATAYGVHFLWLQRALDPFGGPGHAFPQFLPSAALIVFYWLLFRIAYIRPHTSDEREDTVSSLTAILNSGCLLGLLKYQSSHPEWAFYGLLVLGCIEMAFSLYARRHRRIAFIILSTTASVLLLAAIPIRFSGAHWTLLWLLEAEALFIAGLRMRERVFLRLGILAAFVAAIQLAINDVAPVVQYRLTNADAGRHLHLAITLAAAALLYWFNGEFVPRRWPEIVASHFEEFALQASSYLGLIAAATGLYLCFPNAQTAILWTALVLALGLIADRLDSNHVAFQADLLALVLLARTLLININATSQSHGITHRALSIALTCAGLYLGTRRKTTIQPSDWPYVAPCYSSGATGLLVLLAWYELRPVSVAVAWAILGLVLFELGILRRRGYLRYQGYLLLAASFLRIFFANLNIESLSHLGPRVYTVLPLAAAYFWTYVRLRSSEASPSSRETRIGQLACWIGTATLAILAYFEAPPNQTILAWALLSLLAIVLAWLCKQKIFLLQSQALALAVLFRAVLFNIFATPPIHQAVLDTRLASVSLSALLLFLALPIAFRLRNKAAATDTNWLALFLARPEQPLFFIPLLAITLLVSVEMRAGMITVAWSSLGLLVFLFALLVRERSYRLAGLGLLLLGVGKILIIDVWHLGPTDRYITLIVMGVALLLVSFLYTRYRETILKFL